MEALFYLASVLLLCCNLYFMLKIDKILFKLEKENEKCNTKL